jgi:hypothetical protein
VPVLEINATAAAPITAAVDSSGSFVMDKFNAGQYRLLVDGLESDFYTKEARWGTADVLNRVLDSSGADPDKLEIVLSPNGGEVEGTVIDDHQQIYANATVALVPKDLKRIDLYKTAQSDRAGHFALQGVAPGEYSLYAWEHIVPNGYFDPQLIAEFKDQSVFVKATESMKSTLRVTVIDLNSLYQ